MFATGAMYDPAAPDSNMYGMLQCMRDRTAAECDQCLQDSVQRLPSCCYGHQGVVSLGYNCYLRVEIDTYYNLALDAPPIPPPLAPSPSSFTPLFTRERQGKTGIDVILAVALSVGTVLLVVAFLVAVLQYKRNAWRKITPPDDGSNEDDIGYGELDQLNLPALTAATNNFSKDNKLAEGGFGEVFKGSLHNGEVMAVKRLSKHSSLGFHKLKNELVLVAKLKHKNLMRLLGVCLQEKLLVEEYMPNKNLDTILFYPVKCQLLDWSKRFMIICRVARGLPYLHEESRLKVIHRDLKPSNVLLDADMNSKISYFGLARAFVGDQSRDVTRRPVGTLGYMCPEYAYCGHVSTKSDMFRFGVIVLGMVAGQRSNNTYECLHSTSLLSYVWGKWRTRLAAEVVDTSLGGRYPESEVLNCVEIRLLCVQENTADRPDASAVALMLSSPTTTPGEGRQAPSRPAFFFGAGESGAFDAVTGESPDIALMGNRRPSRVPVSENVVNISDLQPR